MTNFLRLHQLRIFAWLVCFGWLTIGAARVGFADATQVLLEVHRDFAARGVPAFNAFDEALNTVNLNRSDSMVQVDALALPLVAFLEAEKSRLESVMEQLTEERHFDAFNSAVYNYYRIQRPLYIAFFTYRERWSLSYQRILDLRLRVRLELPVVRRLQEFLAEEAINRQLVAAMGRHNQGQIQISAYQTILRLNPIPAATGQPAEAYLEMSPDWRDEWSTMALLATPNRPQITNLLEMTGWKILFLEHAKLDSYLYREQKQPFSIPANLPPDLHTYLAQVGHTAEEITRERNFRASFIEVVVPLLAQAHPIYRPNFEYELAVLWTDLLRTPEFWRHTDSRKLFAPTDVAHFHVDRLKQRLRESQRPVVESLIQNELFRSSQLFHQLRGGALKEALLRVLKRVEFEIILRDFGCFFLHDGAMEFSSCFPSPVLRGGGRLPTVDPLIYITAPTIRRPTFVLRRRPDGVTMGIEEQRFYFRNPWTHEELMHLHQRFDEFLERSLHDDSNPILNGLEAALQGVRAVGDALDVSYRRYQLASELLEGARLLKIIQERSATLDARAETLADSNLIPAHPRADLLVSALESTGKLFGQDTSGFYLTEKKADWFGKFFSDYVAKAVKVQDPVRRQKALGFLDVRLLNPGETPTLDSRGTPIGFVQLMQLGLDTIGTKIMTGHLSGETDLVRFVENIRHGFFSGIVTGIMNLAGTGSRFSQPEGEEPRLRTNTFLNWQLSPAHAILNSTALILQQNNYRYRTGSASVQMVLLNDEIQRRIQSESTRAEDPRSPMTPGLWDASIILENLKRLFEIADHLGIQNLRLELLKLFQRMVHEGDVYKLYQLTRDVRYFGDAMQQERQLVRGFFAEPMARDQELRGVFIRNGNAPVYRAYMDLQADEIKTQFPMLFFKLTMPLSVGSQIRNGQGIELYKVIQGIESAMMELDYTREVFNAIESLRNQPEVHTADDLNQEYLSHVLDFENLLLTATRNLSDHRTNLEVLWSLKLAEIDLSAPGHWWRALRLRRRELQPALRDETTYYSCTVPRPEMPNGGYYRSTCPVVSKAVAAVVATFLDPYLRAASEANLEAINALGDPSYTRVVHSPFADEPTEMVRVNRRDVLLQSAAYRDLMKTAAISNVIGDELQRMHDESVYWDVVIERAARAATQSNERLFHYFLVSSFLPKPPHWLDKAIHYSLLGVAVTDFRYNFIHAQHLSQNYSMLIPFARISVFNDTPGLIPRDDLSKIIETARTEAERLAARFSNDLFWFGSSALQAGAEPFSIYRNWRNRVAFRESLGRQRLLESGRTAQDIPTPGEEDARVHGPDEGLPSPDQPTIPSLPPVNDPRINALTVEADRLERTAQQVEAEVRTEDRDHDRVNDDGNPHVQAPRPASNQAPHRHLLALRARLRALRTRIQRLRAQAENLIRPPEAESSANRAVDERLRIEAQDPTDEDFRVLGVARDTPLDRIRSRYASLVRFLHPDSQTNQQHPASQRLRDVEASARRLNERADRLEAELRDQEQHPDAEQRVANDRLSDDGNPHPSPIETLRTRAQRARAAAGRAQAEEARLRDVLWSEQQREQAQRLDRVMLAWRRVERYFIRQRQSWHRGEQSVPAEMRPVSEDPVPVDANASEASRSSAAN